MVKNFLNDENGAIVSIELVLIITIAVLALIVGWSEVAVAVNTELNDISNAVGSLNQSFGYVGFVGNGGGKTKSFFFGSTFTDAIDTCDTNTDCDLIGAGLAAPANVGG
jgi:Flp pilus assembly pilin Flp